MTMKKAALGLFLVLGISTLFFYREPLTQKWLCWSLPRYCETLFGAHLTSEEVESRDGRLILRKPLLTRSPTATDPWKVEAETACITYKWGIWPLTLGLEVGLEKPHATLGQGSVHTRKFPSSEQLNSGFLHLDIQLTANDGLMEIAGDETTKTTQRVYFTVNEWDLARAVGSVDVQFTDSSSDSNCCQISIEGDRQSGRACLQFAQMDMAEAYLLARHWVQELDLWRISHGMIDGEMRLGWEDGRWRSNGEGILSLSQVLFDIPGRSMNGRLGDAKIVMPAAERESAKTLLGTLHLLDGSGLTLFRGVAPQTTFHDVLGEISFNDDASIELALRGMVHQNREPRKVRINGTVSFAEGEQEALDLQIRASSELRSEFLADLTYSHPTATSTDFKGHFNRLSESEWTALSILFGNKFNDLSQWRLKWGTIDGAVHLTAENGTLQTAELNNLFCRGLHIANETKGITASCDTLAGDLSFETDPLAIIVRPEGKLSLADGKLTRMNSDGEVHRVDDLDAELNFVGGTLEQSAIRFSAGDLEGVIDIDWPAAHEVLRAKITGSAESALAFLPANLKRGFGQTLGFHQLTITASAARAETGLAQVMGILQMGDRRQDEEQDILHFGFNLYKHEALATEGDVAKEFAAPMSKSLTRPEFAFAGLVMKDGWFWGHHLSLAKYANPVAAQLYPAALQGVVDVSGDFGAWAMACRFNARDLQLETPKLLVQMPQLGPLPEDARTDDDYLGEITFDFLHEERHANIPLIQAAVQYKPRNVWFTSLDALARIDTTSVTIDGITTEAQGIRIEGTTSLDLTQRELILHPRRVFGKLSNFQRLLTQLGEDTFSRLPIEGNVFSEQDNIIKLNLSADQTQAEAKFEGSIRSATLSTHLPGISTKDIETDFTYDHATRSLDLQGLRGRILVGEGLTTDEYTLRGEHVRFFGFPNTQADFDLRVEGRTQELARLAGNTSRAQKYGSGTVSVVFDNALTHLGAIQPNVRQLVLKNWTEVLQFEAEPVVEFNGLVQDLHRFAQPISLVVSRSALESLMNHDLEGRLFGQLRYQKGDPALKIEARGDHITIDNRHIASCVLSAERYPHRWVLEQLMLDDLSLTADVTLTPHGARVAFAGGRFQDSLLLGIEGTYDQSTGQLEGFVNLLEMELADAPQLFSVFKEWPVPLKGNVRAFGPVSVEFLTTPPYLRATGDFRLEAHNLGVAKWTVPSIQNVVCHLATERGISLHNLNLMLVPNTKALDNVSLDIGSLDFDFHAETTRIKEATFKCPAKNLPWAANRLKEYARGLVDEKLMEAISEVKTTGTVNGQLEGERSPTYHAFRFELDEDVYALLGTTHHLKNVTVEKDPFEFKFNATGQWGDAIVTAELRTDAQGGNGGILTVRDEPSTDPNADPLQIHWEYHEDLGLDLTKAVGSVRGLDMSLTSLSGEATNEAMSLGGRVRVNWQKASPILPDDLADAINQWKMGAGYELSGKWTFPRTTPFNFSFVGILGGRDVALAGYRFENLFAHVDYAPDALELHSLKLVDSAGEWAVPTAFLKRNELDAWELKVPLITATQVRPSLLRGTRNALDFPRSLAITTAQVHSLTGILNNSNTYRAKGELSFVNPSRSNKARGGYTQTSFADVDTPVTGELNFDLKDGKIGVTRARDLFSEGRHVQFLLQDDVPSYLTLDGRLFLNLKLASRGLMFDEMPPTQMTIRGTVANPIAETYFSEETAEEAVR